VLDEALALLFVAKILQCPVEDFLLRPASRKDGDAIRAKNNATGASRQQTAAMANSR
jgi:hypothetical protein